MQQRRRYALALLAGPLAGAASYAVVAPVTGTLATWVAVGLNTVVWMLGAGLYTFVLSGLGARVDAPASDQLRRGGTAGTLSAAVLVAAGIGVVVAAFTSAGVGAVAGLFFLGISLAFGALGLFAVSSLFARRIRADRDQAGDGSE